MIGENIKRLRKEKGLQQKDLAKLLNVAPSAISAWEIGRNEPLMGKIEQLSKIFDVPKSVIIGEDTIENVKKQFEMEQFFNDISKLTVEKQLMFKKMTQSVLDTLKEEGSAN